MSYVASTHPLVKDLIEAGVIPKECRRFSLVMNVGEPIVFKSEVYVTEEQFQSLCDGMKHLDGKDCRTETFVFSRSRPGWSDGVFVKKEGVRSIDITQLGDTYETFSPSMDELAIGGPVSEDTPYVVGDK